MRCILSQRAKHRSLVSLIFVQKIDIPRLVAATYGEFVMSGRFGFRPEDDTGTMNCAGFFVKKVF